MSIRPLFKVNLFMKYFIKMDNLFFLTFLVDYNRDTFHLNAARFQTDKVIFLCRRPTAPSVDPPARPRSTCLQVGTAPCISLKSSPTSVHNRSPEVDLGKQTDNRAVSGMPTHPAVSARLYPTSKGAARTLQHSQRQMARFRGSARLHT